jgi:hypothetical protein
VRDIYNVRVGIDFQYDAFQCANEMIVGAVVGRQGDDWPGYQGSAFQEVVSRP